jgi:hypothetical protein
VDTWGTDDEEAFGRDDRHVPEVGYPIGQNRTSAEPDIEAEVVPFLLGSVIVIEWVEVSSYQHC